MKTLGALFFFLTFNCFNFAWATSIDCIASDLHKFRIDFSPQDSSALLINIPQKENEAPLQLMPLQTDDENTVVFFVETQDKAMAFIFTVEGFSQAANGQSMDGAYVYSTGEKHDLDQEMPIVCKKN